MGRRSQARLLGLGIWCGLLLGLGRLGATPSNESVLLPPRATVVLLVGVPGDVESENAYREQLQSWLQIAAANAQVHHVFVLCDNPETVTFPAKSAAEAIKGDRNHFLGLARTLAGATNPLVVIAWGHGGLQRATPVFHVRGPRLTPSDFATLAEQAGPVTTHWVLLFRGSGAFARQLAGPERQILSSDSDTAFTSDPVSMPILLKLAEGNAASSFEALAEKFGRATAAWYSERNLARTEEPALWLAGTQPRLLAPAAEPEVASAAPDAPPLETTNSGPEAAVASEPLRGELAAYWKEIHRVQPKQYPEADAVILRRRLNCTLASNPAISTEQEEFIQILSPEGKQFGDFDISYSPPHEDITFLDCEVLGPDGKLARLDADAISEAGERSVGDYQLGRRKFFSLPGVVPGAVLHVRYRTTWKDFPLPHISMEIPMAKDLPVLEASVQVSVPKTAAFHFAFEGLSTPDPQLEQTTYSATYTWRFAQIPPSLPEPLTAHRQKPRLLLSTFPDWTAFAEWYGRISQLTDELTPELSAKAKELTRDAKTDRDRVLALYNYVTRLRYVAIPLGVNSFRPHAAANVLQNQFGDCKDKANLFNALLHSLDIKANLVLVPRFSQARDAVPGLAFNHAISRVDLEGQPVWVDTTDDVCRFGLLPPGDPGRNVLVIDGHTSALSALPEAAANEHVLTIKGQIDCGASTDALPVTLSARARGYPDYELRTAAREAKEGHASLPLLSARFRPAIGAFALETQHATAVSALEEDFTWQAQGTGVGFYSATPGKGSLRAPFWLPREWELALHRRQAPLFLNQGYPLTLEETMEFDLPSMTQRMVLPTLCENSAGPLRWRVGWARLADDKLAARFHAELVRGELSAEETPVFQQQLRALLAALGAETTLSRAR